MSDRPGQYPPPIKGQSQPPARGQYPPPITQGQNRPPTAPGQYPPPSAPGQYPPPSAPGQYPAPSAPGQYPPAGAPGQYPPPGAPGQYPPPGAPGQYPPPGAPGQYPPPGAPGQYPPPGAPGQYPPPGAPGQYPPPGAPGQYPPPGAPGQYPPPGAPGQYPPPGAPGAPGQYPPPGAPGAPGQYPPPGAPGQYPPPGVTYPAPGAPGHYPPPGAPGQFPPHGPSGGIGPQGQDTVDSDGDNYLCTKQSDQPIEVKFVNRTNSKVTLYWVNEKGKFKKITKIKRGHTEDVDTFATHPFVADTKDDPGAVINGNAAFVVENVSGGNRSFRAEITNEPRRNNIRSTLSGTPVALMFSNRTHKTVSVKWIDTNGHPKVIKELAPKKAWLFNSCEGHYFTACERGREREEMDLNYGWFYLVTRSSNPGAVKKVLITEPMDDSSSSSSSD